MPVVALTFLAEAAATSMPCWSPADRSAEMMNRLRHPFRTQPDDDHHDTMPDTA